MRRTLTRGLTLVVISAVATVGLAQIKRTNLKEMVADTDEAVYGEILSKRVFRVDHPTDGVDLFYTAMTVRGTTLDDDTPITVDVTFRGGFISETEGVYNSEAPSADDTKIGNRVVVFYKYTDNMGGDVRGNVLFGGHGGLFRTVEGREGSVVLGRGAGYAVAKNSKLTDLGASIKNIKAAQKR